MIDELVSSDISHMARRDRKDQESWVSWFSRLEAGGLQRASELQTGGEGGRAARKLTTCRSLCTDQTHPLASLIWWKTSCLWGGGGRSRSLSSRRPRPNWGDLSLNAPHINFSCNSHTFTWSSSGTSCWLALKILEILGAGSTGVIKYLSFDNTNVLVVKVASNTKALDCNDSKHWTIPL